MYKDVMKKNDLRELMFTDFLKEYLEKGYRVYRRNWRSDGLSVCKGDEIITMTESEPRSDRNECSYKYTIVFTVFKTEYDGTFYNDCVLREEVWYRHPWNYEIVFRNEKDAEEADKKMRERCRSASHWDDYNSEHGWTIHKQVQTEELQTLLSKFANRNGKKPLEVRSYSRVNGKWHVTFSDRKGKEFHIALK